MTLSSVNIFIVIQLIDFTECPLGPGSVLDLGDMETRDGDEECLEKAS